MRRAIRPAGRSVLAIVVGLGMSCDGGEDVTRPDGFDVDAIAAVGADGSSDAISVGVDASGVMLDAIAHDGFNAIRDAMSDASRGDVLDGGAAGDVRLRDRGPIDGGSNDRDPVDGSSVPDARPDGPLDPTREHRCDDGLDDDGDGAPDCFDGDCLDDAPCQGVPETPVQHVQELFLQRCGCHTGALDLGGLRLVRPFTDYTVDRPAVLDPDRALVAPGDPLASFLYIKLLDGLPPDQGERMPPEIPYFDDAQLARVAGWIADLPAP